MTTLHMINSAVVKLSKLTRASKCWRGIAGGLLPEAFWHPNTYGVAGGVEFGFMSTTCQREVALQYASQGGAGVVLEIQQVGAPSLQRKPALHCVP